MGDKIGIFGGTFDPIHVGHLIMAEQVKHEFKLNKVLFIPTGMPPHKSLERVSNRIFRLSMVKIATEDNIDFIVEDIEVNRDGYTYTIDTLRQLKTKYNDAELFYIIGADLLFDLLTWKDFEQVIKSVSFITLKREGFSDCEVKERISYLREKFSANIYLTKFAKIEISSTDIRNRISENISIRYLVSKEVEEYIHKSDVYLG